MRRLFATACAALLATQAIPHPHIFVDAGVTLIFDDQGRLSSLKLRWSYDELFSLIILEDREMDQDSDGHLTADEQANLTGFDIVDWPEWYDGDLYVLVGDTKLAVEPPRDYDLVLQDGKLITTHIRDLAEPLAIGDEGVVVQVYDEGYYTAYEITEDTVLANAPETCAAQTYYADLTAAQKQVKAALAEFSADVSLEEVGFPKIGAAFSDEVRVSC